MYTNDEVTICREDSKRLLFLYSGTRTTSHALITLEMKLCSGEKISIAEVREAIDDAIKCSYEL